MSLAGSFALNVGRAETNATIDSTSDLQVLGTVNVLANSQANVSSKSDASAVAIPPGENNQTQNNSGSTQTPTRPDPSQTGVGVAIAVNAARVKTEASLEGGAKVRATALSVEAGTAASGEQDHSFNVQSISGTGVDKIGFAGSLSIQSVENDSLATIRNGAVVQLTATTDPDLAAVSQNLKVTSRNETISQAKADASVAGGPRSGIGPSIVVNASQNSSHAEVTGANFTARSMTSSSSPMVIIQLTRAPKPESLQSRHCKERVG